MTVGRIHPCRIEVEVMTISRRRRNGRPTVAVRAEIARLKVSGARIPAAGATINSQNLPEQFTSGAVSIGPSAPASPTSETPAQPFSFSASSPETTATAPGTTTSISTPRSNTFNSTATGDIKLNPSGKKKSKKPVFIIIILVILLGVGGFLFASGTISSWVGGDGGSSIASLGDAQRAFARYANYLLYGEEKDELEGEYNPSVTYELDRQLYNSDPDAEYWKKSESLLNTAIETYGKVEGKSENVLLDLEKQKNIFDFLSNYQKNDSLTFEDILSYYSIHGYGKLVEFIDQRYDNLNVNNPIFSRYIDYQKEAYRGMLDALNLYILNGCIIEARISEDCVDKLDESTFLKIDELYRRGLELNMMIDSEISQSLHEIIFDIFIIRNDMLHIVTINDANKSGELK